MQYRYVIMQMVRCSLNNSIFLGKISKQVSSNKLAFLLFKEIQDVSFVSKRLEIVWSVPSVWDALFQRSLMWCSKFSLFRTSIPITASRSLALNSSPHVTFIQALKIQFSQNHSHSFNKFWSKFPSTPSRSKPKT